MNIYKKKNTFISMVCICIFFCLSAISEAEKVPAGYVAQWDTLPLSEIDFKISDDKSCQSFGSILQDGKLEMPHIIPFKIINNTLTNFIKGYKLIERDNNMDSINKIDIVVIWPNYEQSNWYVLMGSNSCFISWIEIQPDNLDAVIHSGKKL